MIWIYVVGGIVALALCLVAYWIHTGFIDIYYTEWTANDPFSTPELVERIDAGGLLVLKSGERIRIKTTERPKNLSFEALGGMLMSGVSGDLGKDVEASKGIVQIERLGKSDDGATHANVWVAVDVRKRWSPGVHVCLAQIPVIRRDTKPIYALEKVHVWE